MVYDSLKQYEEQLRGTSMTRIHKSFLVNMQYVKKVLAEEAVMVDGKHLSFVGTARKHGINAFTAIREALDGNADIIFA